MTNNDQAALDAHDKLNKLDDRAIEATKFINAYLNRREAKTITDYCKRVHALRGSATRMQDAANAVIEALEGANVES